MATTHIVRTGSMTPLTLGRGAFLGFDTGSNLVNNLVAYPSQRLSNARYLDDWLFHPKAIVGGRYPAALAAVAAS